MSADKPEIDFPDGPPPSDLEVTELSEGDGQEATAGSTVSVHYVGVAHSTGEEVDASYNRAPRSTSASASARSSPGGTRESRG